MYEVSAMNTNDKATCKFLSLILRHKPETIGLSLDDNGWTNTNELLNKMNAHGYSLTFEQLKRIVDSNDKKRFAFSEDHSSIRANQGHSIEIDLNLQQQQPPDTLYHGTAERNIESIKQQGLLKGSRHHVHLSADTETARRVGMRYGKPVVLSIDAKRMQEDGCKFYRSENGVWLTEYVSCEFIIF
jgi:putative RNA 2'-phosphotransferase